MAFRVCAAKPGDERVIADIHRRSALEAYDWVPPARWQDAAWAERVERGEVLVAKRDARTVGFAATGPHEIGALYVDPGAQRLGIGMTLLIAAEHQLGRGRATLWVIERNFRARRFYEHAGWTFDGRRQDAVWGYEMGYAKNLAG